MTDKYHLRIGSESKAKNKKKKLILFFWVNQFDYWFKSENCYTIQGKTFMKWSPKVNKRQRGHISFVDINDQQNKCAS